MKIMVKEVEKMVDKVLINHSQIRGVGEGSALVTTIPLETLQDPNKVGPKDRKFVRTIIALCLEEMGYEII